MPPAVLRQAPTPEHISTAPANPPCPEKSRMVGRGLVRVIIRTDAKAVAWVGVADNFARIEQVFRIEAAFDRLEGRVDLRAEELAIPEAAGEPVAVFSAHGAAELDDQVRHFTGDRTQGLRRRRPS